MRATRRRGLLVAAGSCSASTGTTQTNCGTVWTIPASGSSVLSLASSPSMNTNACQGARFTVFLKVGP